MKLSKDAIEQECNSLSVADEVAKVQASTKPTNSMGVLQNRYDLLSGRWNAPSLKLADARAQRHSEIATANAAQTKQD